MDVNCSSEAFWLSCLELLNRDKTVIVSVPTVEVFTSLIFWVIVVIVIVVILVVLLIHSMDAIPG